MPDTQKEIQQLINEASPEVRKVLAEVFAIERDKLYMSTPHGITEEIVDVIKEIVK